MYLELSAGAGASSNASAVGTKWPAAHSSHLIAAAYVTAHTRIACTNEHSVATVSIILMHQLRHTAIDWTSAALPVMGLSDLVLSRSKTVDRARLADGRRVTLVCLAPKAW
jgi:hypothetical protein